MEFSNLDPVDIGADAPEPVAFTKMGIQDMVNTSSDT